MNKVLKKIIFVGVMLSMGAVVRPAAVDEMIKDKADELFAHVCELAQINGEIQRVSDAVRDSGREQDLDSALAELRGRQQGPVGNITELLGLFNQDVASMLEVFFSDSLKQIGLPACLLISSPGEAAGELADEVEQEASDQPTEYSYEPVTFSGVDLPNELIARIAACADTQTFGRLAQACRHLHEVVDSVPVAEKVQRLLEKNDPDAVQILDPVIESKPDAAELRALKEGVQNNLIWAVKPLLEMSLASCGEDNPHASRQKPEAVINEEREIIKRNALEWAVHANNKAIARLLVEECGVDVDQFFTNTLLRDFAWFGTADQIRLLLGLGANPNIRDLEKISSLAAAIETDFGPGSVDRIEKVRLLCEYGATVERAYCYRDKHGLTLASEKGYIEVVEILIGKLREELELLRLEEKNSREVFDLFGRVIELQYGRERFAELLNEALQAARAAGQDEVVAVLERALEEGLPEPAGPAPKQDKE